SSHSVTCWCSGVDTSTVGAVSATGAWREHPESRLRAINTEMQVGFVVMVAAEFDHNTSSGHRSTLFGHHTAVEVARPGGCRVRARVRRGPARACGAGRRVLVARARVLADAGWFRGASPRSFASA